MSALTCTSRRPSHAVLFLAVFYKSSLSSVNVLINADRILSRPFWSRCISAQHSRLWQLEGLCLDGSRACSDHPRVLVLRRQHSHLLRSGHSLSILILSLA